MSDRKMRRHWMYRARRYKAGQRFDMVPTMVAMARYRHNCIMQGRGL